MRDSRKTGSKNFQTPPKDGEPPANFHFLALFLVFIGFPGVRRGFLEGSESDSEIFSGFNNQKPPSMRIEPGACECKAGVLPEGTRFFSHNDCFWISAPHPTSVDVSVCV